jgi:uncharacterized lipoprotein YddW (UPF0748 family)
MTRFAFLLFALLSALASWADAPFNAAYVHLHRVALPGDTVEKRLADIDASIASAKGAGLNIVMPYAADSSGRAYYPGAFHPDSLYGEWDALGAYINAARAAGLTVYPAVPVLICGHDAPAGILQVHPEWALREKDGALGGYISPANPEARAWVAGMLKELVARYALEGVLLDYLRYPNKPIDLDPVGAAAFAAANPDAKHAITDRGGTPWQRFKESQLTALMAEIKAALPDTTLALYCWGPHVASGHYVGQRWADWAKAGYLDIINVSGYCYTDNYGEKYMDVFRQRLADARALVKPEESDARFTFCLGVVTSHGKIKSTSEIPEYIAAAKEAGIEGVAYFTLNTLEELAGTGSPP